jgi:hypothetical protein
MTFAVYQVVDQFEFCQLEQRQIDRFSPFGG